MALWGLAWMRAAGRLELTEALGAAEEAIAIFEALVAQLPDAFSGSLQAAQRTRAEVLEALGAGAARALEASQ
jgi:hypothetical protein